MVGSRVSISRVATADQLKHSKIWIYHGLALKFSTGRHLLYRPSHQRQGIAQRDATQRREYQSQGRGPEWKRSERCQWELVYITYTRKLLSWGNNTRWGKINLDGSLPDGNIVARRRKSEWRKWRSRYRKMLWISKREVWSVQWDNSLGQVCTHQLRHRCPVYPWIYVVRREQNNARLSEKHILI